MTQGLAASQGALPSSMDRPQVYTWDPNSNSGKPLFVLSEKGAAFDYHYIDLLEFEQHRAEYLAINPAGTVPTLIHNGLTFTESTEMGEYLDAVIPGPRFVPDDPAQRYAMRLRCRLTDIAAESISVIGWNNSLGPMVRSKSPEELERLIARIPTEERRVSWRRASQASFSEQQLADAQAKVVSYVRELDAVLAGSPWLAGADFTLADIATFANFYSLPLSNPDACPEADVPHFIDWLRRIYARPATMTTFALARSIATRAFTVADLLGVKSPKDAS